MASTAPRAPRPSVCRLCALLLRRAACCVFFVFCLCSAVVVCPAAVFAVGRSAACAWVGVCACVASRRIGARASGVLWVCVGALRCWGAGVVLWLFFFVCAGIAPFGRPGVVSCGRGVRWRRGRCVDWRPSRLCLLSPRRACRVRVPGYCLKALPRCTPLVCPTTCSLSIVGRCMVVRVLWSCGGTR